MSLTEHFEREDLIKNMLFNANDERQEEHARSLLRRVKEEEETMYV